MKTLNGSNPLNDLADQAWLHAPTVSELRAQAASRLVWAATGWLAAAVFAALFLFVALT